MDCRARCPGYAPLVPRRRLLLAVALALLALGLIISLGARGGGGETSLPSSPSPGPRPEPATISATLAPGAARQQRVRARLGDLVELRVLGTAPDSVTVTGYGEVQPVDPQNPARFDFIADRTGSFPVRFTASGRVAGVLVVRPVGAG